MLCQTSLLPCLDSVMIHGHSGRNCYSGCVLIMRHMLLLLLPLGPIALQCRCSSL